MGLALEGRRRFQPVTAEVMRASAMPVPESGCWLWTRATNPGGYGILTIDKKTVTAHRASLELHTGKTIPHGSVVMHKCDTPSCINPDHLQVGTRGENNKDRSVKGRDAHKLSGQDVLAIFVDSRNQSVIAAEYGIHQSTVSDIKTGRRRGRITGAT